MYTDLPHAPDTPAPASAPYDWAGRLADKLAGAVTLDIDRAAQAVIDNQITRDAIPADVNAANPSVNPRLNSAQTSVALYAALGLLALFFLVRR